jgi:anaerobic selenocysteine-containing dehydrogenase
VPAGSDLIEEWQFFWEVAARMGLQLRVPLGGWSIGGRAGETERPVLDLDMPHRPSTEELISQLTAFSRVPLEEVKRHPHGAIFADPSIVVEEPESGWAGRFVLDDAGMLADLAALREPAPIARGTEERFPYRLVCRRMMHVYNSSGNVEPINHGRPYNPAYLNPDDMTALGLVDGSTITLESRTAAIPAIAHADPHLLRGLVSIAFGFGGPPDWDELYRTVGSSVNRLIDDETHYDPISGQPRMSDIPVAVLVSDR